MSNWREIVSGLEEKPVLRKHCHGSWR